MTQVRLLIGLVAATGSLLTVVACSSSTTGSGTSSSSSSGAAGDGGASSSSSGSSGASSSSGGPKQCAPANTTCTDAETQAYGSCIENACDSTFQMCYGADYKSGTYSGACASYITCTQACACGDTTCLSKCTITPECTSCVGGFATCSKSCTAPACYTAGSSSGSSGSSGTSGSSGSGGKTCADLQACCAALSGQEQTTCDSAYTSANGVDASCSAIYTALNCSN